MKAQKILIVVLAAIMLCTALVSCGGGSSQEPAEPAPQAPQAPPSNSEQDPPTVNNGGDTDDGLELYLDAMNDFITGTDSLMEGLDELMELADYISSEEELEVWCYLFIETKNAVGFAADQLAELAPLAPEDYVESHLLVTFALAAIYDAMTGFEFAVDAAVSGDEDSFFEGLGMFVGNLIAAAEMWAEAVGY